MVDILGHGKTSTQLGFYSDASASEILGYGAVFGNHWLFGRWEPGYIREFKPSIEYLELYAVVAAILTWESQLKNLRFTLFCDNSAVVEMINSQVSRCKNCMYLI